MDWEYPPGLRFRETALPDGRSEFFLFGHWIALYHDPEPIELRLGREPETPTCLIVSASQVPQLGAEFVIVQPEVVSEDLTRGWIPLGGRHGQELRLGRQDSPALRLGPDVSRNHCMVTVVELGIEIADDSGNGTVVIARPERRIREWPGDPFEGLPITE